ncbi:hypothetical protein [Streptomyces sp. TS71-3]|uniref:hypothetical protein n=1 Tax=Streptomyces sp. TS71-3 TaxID=2733862 RepID=UPI001B08190F|nr:hypothetical protein [Streptomyces sp. TS71-3]GHJ35029.1 hypothetical protein Sm713_06380 [Streptomyces sp. TS71-3]
MNYLRGFVPWIAFAAVSAAGWQWGALAGLVLGLVVFLATRRAGVPADALILEISTVSYFVLLTAFAFAVPDSPVAGYCGALSFSWLALTAWGTLGARRPFTLGIARRSTPREFWETPQFLRINNVITLVWATAFVLTAAAVAACDALHAGTGAQIACQVVGFAVPAVFTARYPKIVQARYAALGGAA